MSRSLSRFQAIVLGGGVLCGIAVAGVALVSVGSRQWLWNDTLHLRVGFHQIHGVEVGTRVRVLGKEAGEVEAVNLPPNPTGQVELLLRVDGGARHLIRTDASAQIVAVGMVGSQVVEITPGSDQAAPIEDDATIASRSTTDLTALLAKMDQSLQQLGQGQGSLGKLLKEDDAYRELLQLVKQSRGTLASLKQDADAIKALPFVRNYVHDPAQMLFKPECERNRQSLPAAGLFEPGSAILHDAGRGRLDELAPWLQELKSKGSEVVVAAYADPAMDVDLAIRVTQSQSEAICKYLTGNYAIHKTGWFSRRKVTPLGCGTSSSPVPDDQGLPAPRVDILVFVPRS